MAPGVNLIILKVFPDFGETASSVDVEQAAQWVVDNAATYNIAAVNFSLGFGNFNSAHTSYLHNEFQDFIRLGIAPVVASGNSFFGNGSTPGVASPAADSLAWGVGGVWDANVGTISFNSGAIDSTTAPDRIMSITQRTTVPGLVDILAPGGLITNASLNNGTDTLAGTSMAAPHIAGIVALAQEYSVQLTGGRLPVSTLLNLMRSSGKAVVDGDDENDNVDNTGGTFRRVDVYALMDDIQDYYAARSGSVKISDVTLTEGNSGTKVMTFTVTRTGGTEAFSIHYTTANDFAIGGGSDYVGTSGNLSFASGVKSKTISVTIKGDTAIEGNERFFVNLSGGTNGVVIADGQGIGTITNDDVTAPVGSVRINDVAITEGDFGTKVMTFTVTRTGGTGAFAVNYASANDTAVAGSDYVAAAGTLAFASGEMSRTITITINGDETIEPSESFLVNLSGGTNAVAVADSQGRGTISDDDSTAVGNSVSISDVTIAEGNAGTRLATFTVTRTGGNAAFNVNYATTNGTALSGSDYVPTTGTLTFTSGVNSRTISVTINGDTVLEPDESFLVNLSGATNGATIVDSQGIGTITDDDNPNPFTEGSDTVALPQPNKTWHALGGNDNIVGTGGIDTVFGDAGNDISRGRVDGDRLDGGAGDDVLDGGTGPDVLTGRAGSDRYVVDTADDVIVETAASGGSDVVFTTVSYVLRTGVSVETLQSTNTSASVAPTLVGNELVNTIIGDLGNNVIDGGRGADGLYGHGGHDVYLVDHAGDRVFEGVNAGFDHVNSSVSFTLGANLETLTLLGSAAVNGTGNALPNTITGNGAANTLSGGANNDRLEGGGGNDRLDGGAEADFLIGGDGDDRYVVDGQGETIIEIAGGGNDLVFTSVSLSLAAGLSVETLRSANTNANAAITMIGNEIANTIVGDLGNNVLDGGQGADQMQGLGGNDAYLVDHVADKVVEGANAGFDQINSTVSFTLGGGVESLTLTGSAAINGTGNTLANTVYGNAAANVLDGRQGSDGLTGGGGNDTFSFTTALGEGNVDHLADFSAVADLIQIENAIFAALGPSSGVLAAEKFFVGAAAHDADDRIIYDSAAGALIYDFNGSASGGGVRFATLATGLLAHEHGFCGGLGDFGIGFAVDALRSR